MADTYVQSLLAFYPTGPFVVYGNCVGCLVAYEMAQRLHASGRTPAGLILVDPPAHRDQLHLRVPSLERSLRQTVIRKWISDIEEELKDPRLTGEKRRELIKALIERAGAIYMPTPYPGRTLLFVTPAKVSMLMNQRSGYPTLLTNPEVVRLEAEHLQMFKDLRPIAAAIDAFVDGLRTP